MAKHTIQQLIIDHADRIKENTRLPLSHVKALYKLGACRTAALGGHAQYCENNHLNGIWYNSCQHRFCPQCRAMPTEQWLLNTKDVLLKCPHHHIVFTLPSSLHDVWRYNRSTMTDILFKAAQQTLQQFAKDPRYLNARLGILSALHTWGRSLSLHPHIHTLVSHGGINEMGEWVEPKKADLFPQKPIMMVYRGKLLAMVKAAMEEANWQLPPNTQASQLTNRLNKLGRQDWVVYFCKRYDFAQGVASYLSRYVKSGPLKNQQIKSVTDEHVTFSYRSHQTKRTEVLRLSIEDFIERLLQHTPLPGKPTVRYCGLYNSAARKKLNEARSALGQTEVSEHEQLQWQAYLEEKGHLPVCTICGLPLTKMVDIAPVRQVA